jgi:hypothetical protein
MSIADVVTQLPKPFDYFVGRRAEIERLIAFLRGPPGGLAVVIGPPGSGRDTLVQNAVWAILAPEQNTRLAELDAASTPPGVDVLWAAKCLEVPAAALGGLPTATAALATALARDNITLLLTNADLDTWRIGALPVARGNARTIVTTSDDGLLEHLDAQTVVRLEPWSYETCREYLDMRRREDVRIPDVPDRVWKPLCDAVGRQPLALSLLVPALVPSLSPDAKAHLIDLRTSLRGCDGRMTETGLTDGARVLLGRWWQRSRPIDRTAAVHIALDVQNWSEALNPAEDEEETPVARLYRAGICLDEEGMWMHPAVAGWLQVRGGAAVARAADRVSLRQVVIARSHRMQMPCCFARSSTRAMTNLLGQDPPMASLMLRAAAREWQFTGLGLLCERWARALLPRCSPLDRDHAELTAILGNVALQAGRSADALRHLHAAVQAMQKVPPRTRDDNPRQLVHLDDDMAPLGPVRSRHVLESSVAVFGLLDPAWVVARARLDLAQVVAPAEVEAILFPAIDALLDDKDQGVQAVVAANVLHRAGSLRAAPLLLDIADRHGAQGRLKQELDCVGILLAWQGPDGTQDPTLITRRDALSALIARLNGEYVGAHGPVLREAVLSEARGDLAQARRLAQESLAITESWRRPDGAVAMEFQRLAGIDA